MTTAGPEGGTYPAGTPTWEIDELNNLYKGNELSGVNPVIFAAIAEEESHWEDAGAGVNSKNYGGYFGLSDTSKYPTNPSGQVTPSRSVLETNNAASFDEQAEIAAADFASLLKSYGSPESADEHYVGNASPEQTFIQDALAGSTAGDVSTGTNSDPTNIGTPAGDAANNAALSTSAGSETQMGGIGGALQDLDAILNPTGGSLLDQITSLGASDISAVVEMIAVRGILSVMFLGITLGGIFLLIKGPSSTIIPAVQQQQAFGLRRQQLGVQQQNANTNQRRAGTYDRATNFSGVRAQTAQAAEARRSAAGTSRVATGEAGAASKAATAAAKRAAEVAFLA